MVVDLPDAPWIFLDVDGPLIPFRDRPVPRGRHSADVVGQIPDDTGNPLLYRLDPANGRRLLELRGQLAWATTWMAEANDVLSPRLGLPTLPVVDWPDDDQGSSFGLHWKTAFLTQWAAGLPFVWLDDEITEADRRWVADRHPAPALLHWVDPLSGLTEADFTAVHLWLEEMR